MSTVINLVEDHNIYLCEGGPVYNGGVQPTPITYLTKWMIVGNSEVHTLPYPDGVVLPTGYKRCEYLQSDDTAYIEVSFGFDKTDEVYAKAATLDITHIDKYFVSPKVWNDANNRFAMGVHRHAAEGNNPYWCSAYGNVPTSSTFLDPHTAPDTNEHIWQYKNYKFTLDDGSLAKEVNNFSFDSETANLRLFYGYNTPTKCKIYEYRHKKANAEYRLIPCLDSNDTPCMYDVINNQAYYNSAGSGSFTYKLYPQPTEIWSCGEYNPTDGKYHILVQPLGGSIADIALTEPLRKVNDVADFIALLRDNDYAYVIRYLASSFIDKFVASRILFDSNTGTYYCGTTSNYTNGVYYDSNVIPNLLCNKIENVLSLSDGPSYNGECIMMNIKRICVKNAAIEQTKESYQSYFDSLGAIEIIYKLNTPISESVDAVQIEKADSYSCVISQGGKAVEWSSFETYE